MYLHVEPGIDLGYRYFPEAYAGAPGSPRLDIFLRAQPTGRHFDPVEARFLVASAHGVEHLTVRRVWHGSDDPICVCADRVILRDHRGKVEEAFTFGGELRIQPGDALTTCSLTSPAPILEIEMQDTLPTILAEEVEVLLARRRGEQLRHLAAYEQKLSRVDPAVLYAACLSELEAKHRHRDSAETHEFVLAHFLRAEIARLRESGGWPSDEPALAALL